MKEMMLKMIMPLVIGTIEEMITQENLVKYGGKLFDLIEEFVVDSETTIDDAAILPLVHAARKALGIIQ